MENNKKEIAEEVTDQIFSSLWNGWKTLMGLCCLAILVLGFFSIDKIESVEQFMGITLTYLFGSITCYFLLRSKKS